MIVSGSAVAEYVGRRTGATIIEPYTSLGVARQGEIIAGVVFNVWTGPDVQMTIAAEPGALSRAFLRRVGRYATDELGCIRATIETEQAHVAAMALRMGGRVEGVKRDLFGEGRDGTVIGILKRDWFLR
jgi:hypothetical protein